MEFRGPEAAAISVLRARELQRLRRIRQLGLLHLVFPAAEHSRLAHSLGAAHIAIRFGYRLEEASREVLSDVLRVDEEARRDLALAALCHDLGHGPLSHVWEREVVRQWDRTAWYHSLGLADDPPRAQLKWHEAVGQAILRWPDGELHTLLEHQEAGTSKRIAALLLGEHYLPYIPALLSSDIDVDRCDFLLRDAHQTGVAYGRFDLDWLISTATVGEREDGEIVVGFDRRKAPRVVEQFLVARRALYDTVYQHKTVRSAEGMLGLLLRRLREIAQDTPQLFKGNQLFKPYRAVLAGEPLTVPEILELDDYSLWMLVMHVAERSDIDPTAADLAGRLVRRDLFKHAPADPDALDTFLFERQDELPELVAPYCQPYEPKFYFHIDKGDPFVTLHDEGSGAAHLIEEIAPDALGHAHAAAHEPALRMLGVKGAPQHRLFVPRSAVNAVVQAIEG